MLTTRSDSPDALTSLSGRLLRPRPPSLVLDAEAIWRSLRAGREQIIASFCSETECHLELELTPGRSPMSEECSAALECCLRGESQKFIALESARAPSTVTLRLRRALAFLGLSCATGAVPTALINIAQVAWGKLPPLIGQSQPVPAEPLRRLISVRRPDPRALRILSRAEAHVVDLLVEAKARNQLAQFRGTSPRTIANQLAQVYKKLHLTGRIPLLIRIIEANAYVESEPPMLALIDWASAQATPTNVCAR